MCCFTLFNLQGTRRFPAGFYFTSSSFACQVLFSLSSQLFSAAQASHSTPSAFIRGPSPLGDSLFIISARRSLVKYFFQEFSGLSNPSTLFFVLFRGFSSSTPFEATRLLYHAFARLSSAFFSPSQSFQWKQLSALDLSLGAQLIYQIIPSLSTCFPIFFRLSTLCPPNRPFPPLICLFFHISVIIIRIHLQHSPCQGHLSVVLYVVEERKT